LITFWLASFTATAQVPPGKPVELGPLTLSGSLRTRFEAWDWFDGDADGSYGYSGTILRLSLGQQKSTHDWQLELAAPLLLGLPDDAIAPGAQGQLGLGPTYFASNDRHRNSAMVFAKQAFVRFKNLGGNEAHSLRLGRFEFIDGTEVVPKNTTLAALKRDRIGARLLGTFVFTHVGRSVDGLHYVYNTAKTNVTFVGARPTRGVFQTDGWGQLNTAFGYLAVTRPVSYSKRSGGEWRLFVLHYHDWRDVLKTDNRTLALRRDDHGNIRVATFGGHYIHSLDTSAGTLDLLFWGALQTGRWGMLEHRAGAGSVEGGFQPAALRRLKPWVRAGWLYGSGDDDPADSTHKTFFQVLPTVRWYARFPFYNFMNNQDLYSALYLRPHQRVSIRTEFHSLRLTQRNDFWYQGGGAFQPWTFGYVGRPSGGNRGLATIWESGLDYQVNPNVGVSFYFANAQGKLVAAGIYPEGRDARLGFLELNYRF
jgi:hypothetical protein